MNMDWMIPPSWMSNINVNWANHTTFYLASIGLAILCLIVTMLVDLWMSHHSKQAKKAASGSHHEDRKDSNSEERKAFSLLNNSPAVLDPEEQKREIETQERQLKEIYTLVAAQQDKFGIHSMDELQEQMRLYRT